MNLREKAGQLCDILLARVTHCMVSECYQMLDIEGYHNYDGTAALSKIL